MFAAHVPVSFADRWAEWGEHAARLEAVEPTPVGEGHLGLVESGTPVQLRFPVPGQPAVGYWLSLGNIVAFTGRGTSYRLILRRDAPDGPVIHEGPVITDGDEWNASNRQAVDITEAVTEADRRAGQLDVYATGIVAGDGWTVYRHNPGRPLLAHAAVPTPEALAQMQAARELERRAVSLIPLPRHIALAPGELPVTPQTRIVHPVGAPPELAVAAEELRELVRERVGLDLAVAAVEAPGAGDLALGLGHGDWAIPADVAPPAEGREAYRLRVTEGGALVEGADAAGCFYGAMTLGQMIRPTQGGPAAPHCTVSDRPAFAYRIIQYDVARGQTINVDYVKRMIRELARLKVNALLFYMENDFRFRKYPYLGREDTFTHEKAQELSAYARRHHMQLIPQFEALGHASAVLRNEELADMREAGDPWVFCTTQPRTWEFLDDVFGELVEAFPDSEFIHVGADEFEFSFGKCEGCLARIEQVGIGGLYADHMNRLNELVKKRGKVMMFWPSHHGPTPELSNMTLQYQDLLEKDCIPTEWIYHGPPTYPTIERYQQAGFMDVFCCPAVESYSRIWPDHVTTFRAIRGFYRAGEERGAGGAYCTTWEFMQGALVENSWYGLVFAADCSWNTRSTTKAEFNRRFADLWWGLRGEDVAARIEDTISEPVPMGGEAALWRNGRLVRDLLWSPPERVMRDFALKQPHAGERAHLLPPLMDAATERLEALAAGATRNDLTFRAARLGFGMMRFAGAKLVTFREATEQYRAAGAALAAGDAPAAADGVERIAVAVADLQEQAVALADGYAHFVDNCGAFRGDLEHLRRQAQQLGALAKRLGELAAQARAGEVDQLPPGTEFGLLLGTYTKLGEWAPGQMSEEGATLRFDAGAAVTQPGPFEVEWEYTRGAHGVRIASTRLLRNGEVVSEDVHSGWAGSGSRGNVYRLELAEHDPAARYEIVGELASSGGTDSRGIVWLVRE